MPQDRYVLSCSGLATKHVFNTEFVFSMMQFLHVKPFSHHSVTRVHVLVMSITVSLLPVDAIVLQEVNYPTKKTSNVDAKIDAHTLS